MLRVFKLITEDKLGLGVIKKLSKRALQLLKIVRVKLSLIVKVRIEDK